MLRGPRPHRYAPGSGDADWNPTVSPSDERHTITMCRYRLVAQSPVHVRLIALQRQSTNAHHPHNGLHSVTTGSELSPHVCVKQALGRTHGGGGEGPGPPWDLKKHYIFRISTVELRDLHLPSLFFKIFSMWED